MADGSDFNGGVALQIEENPVIATAETEACERRLQFFHITGTAGEVAIHAKKDLHSRFAIDRTEIGAGLWGPVNRDAFGRGLLGRFGRFSHFFTPNSRRISS